MKRLLFILFILIVNTNLNANYYGKKTISTMLNDLDKEIKLYCQRNIGKINMKIEKQKREDRLKENKTIRYQLKTENSHTHSHLNNRYTTKECYETEKTKINNYLNTFYNEESKEIFISCFYENKKYNRNISEELPKCIYEKKSANCDYILEQDIEILEKSVKHSKCMFN